VTVANIVRTATEQAAVTLVYSANVLALDRDLRH
jgi:hypothetical protein